jgi:hypothetical protein
MTITRRQLFQAVACTLPWVLRPRVSRGVETTQSDSEGFFTIDRREGRWWFIDPAGDRFFSLGVFVQPRAETGLA